MSATLTATSKEANMMRVLLLSFVLPRSMRTAMSHAGVSITVTSITDFVAFMISTSTSLPALSSFCFYAATGILFLFLFQCLFLVLT